MVFDISDLPTTSPHGSAFGYEQMIPGLAPDVNTMRGTVAAHCDGVFRHHSTGVGGRLWHLPVERVDLLATGFSHEQNRVIWS